MLEIPGFRLLLDCGLFQGPRDEAHRQNRDLGFDPKSLSPVLPSHAHVDHSDALPVLQKQGFSGKTYLTRATADLTELMLEDSARGQVSDCGYVNKKEQRKGKACVRPLYDTDDVRKLVRRFEGTRYGDMLKIAPRVTASFHDAGHILGSAAGAGWARRKSARHPTLRQVCVRGYVRLESPRRRSRSLRLESRA